MLASQTPRIQRLVPAESRKAMSPGAKLGLALLGAAVLTTGIVLVVKYGTGGPRAANATPADPLRNPPPAATTDRVATVPPAGNIRPQPEAPKVIPTTLEMGREPAKPLVAAPANPETNPKPAPQDSPAQTPGSSDAQRPTETAINLAPAPRTPASPAAAPNGGKDTSFVTTDAQRLMQDAMRAQSSGNLVDARTMLNRALLDSSVPANERGAIRSQLASLNDTLLFSPAVAAGDQVCATYTVASGDNLVTIRNKQSLPIDWRLLRRINKINPDALQIGQKIKIVRMPFHAVVHKSEYRMDLFVGEPLTPGQASSAAVGPDGQDPAWIYVRSFDVGLGDGNGTPEGVFTIKPKSKLVNPHWVNPRTGEKFSAEDPKNPIGEHWIGLEGLDEPSKKLTGYGIHGTIDPDSIGKQKSMGCVRMRADDVAMVYELLTERMSAVRIMK